MEEPTKRVTRVNRGQNMKRHIEELLSNDVNTLAVKVPNLQTKTKGRERCEGDEIRYRRSCRY